MDYSPSFANFSGLGETFSRFPPTGAATVEHYFVCVGSSLPKPYIKCAYAHATPLLIIAEKPIYCHLYNLFLMLLQNFILKLHISVIYANEASRIIHSAGDPHKLGNSPGALTSLVRLRVRPGAFHGYHNIINF